MGNLRRVLFVLIASGAAAFVACSSDKSVNVGSGGTGGKPGSDASTDQTSTGGGAGKPDGSAGTTSDSGVSCKSDDECSGKLPTTIPAGCATGKCGATGVCTFVAIDGDGDGHTKALCKSADGSVTIELGDDCDDGDKTTYPNAWDGPPGEGQEDRCDLLDQDCNGTADDGKLSDGTSCSCKPGDIGQCSQDSQGKTITWPTGTPVGVCKYGGRTCLTNGTWGPCADAVPPGQETCNGLDDDCNSIVDDGPAPDKVPTDAPYWAYDGDDDLHARMSGDGYAPIRACAAPTTAPAACTSAPLTGCTLGTTVDVCCPAKGWKLAKALPADDCNDQNKDVNPASSEKCINKIDDNCDSQVDEQCQCVPNSVDYSCATYPNGTPITYPGGVPKGACKYGTKTCAGDGKSWGSCLGAIAPAALDPCTAGTGDEDCDGVISCNCTLGTTQNCSNQSGKCAGSKQTCVQSGTTVGWGPCSIVPTTESCNGVDDDCNGVVDNVAGLGVQCDVGGDVDGACHGGGTWVCGASQLVCQANDPAINSNVFKSTPASTYYGPSWDWNCSGTTEKSPANSSYYTGGSGCSGLYWTLKLDDACFYSFGNATDCNSKGLFYACDPGNCFPSPTGVCPACGTDYYSVTCKWNSTYQECGAYLWYPYKVGCK